MPCVYCGQMATVMIIPSLTNGCAICQNCLMKVFTAVLGPPQYSGVNVQPQLQAHNHPQPMEPSAPPFIPQAQPLPLVPPTPPVLTPSFQPYVYYWNTPVISPPGFVVPAPPPSKPHSTKRQHD